ncbi:MAG: regulatory iron-sulfur-containing complex subunit RicT [Nitrospirota bacterium]
MPEIVGVRFKSCGKIYDFEVNGVDANKGDLVVVESELGLNIGSVVTGRHIVEDPERELKKIVRKATEEDLHQKQENNKLETEARDYCLERIMARGLPMKLVCTEVTLDRKRFIFYFTAERRIDFRELVKDLAARFKMRIEMRQIGVRDEAKIVGGIGICGRELCCTKFLTSFEPISIKMAKRQELVLNTGKLSGVCGRLMCCLGYEYDETSPEDIALTEEDSISISEDAEVFETVVASGDSPKEVEEERQEHKERPSRKVIRHGRKRRRRSHKK